MFRKDVNDNSPLRILERSIHGGLGKGNLGVVMARAGVGKTAFLVQIGLDDALRERPVLHLALGQNLEHVQAWYDSLFDDLAKLTHLEDREGSRTLMNKHRVIHATADTQLTGDALEAALERYREGLRFQPTAILVDGFDWESEQPGRAAELSAFKAAAERNDAELWMTAQTHRNDTRDHPTAITAPCDDYDDVIDLAIFLEPHAHHATVRLLKDHDNPEPTDTHLQLDCDTMRIVTDDTDSPATLPANAFTLLSGGAEGAEAEFGAMAERWGLHEITYSHAGRDTARSRGLLELGERELSKGDVSRKYIESHLGRSFPKTKTFQKILQTIWYQVVTAGEVFVIGEIQGDSTVRGGTGWGAELARHFHKPLHVYDQIKNEWFTWREDAKRWEAVDPPTIRRPRFCGTGTRYLTDQGKAAIQALFEASFGPR